VSGAGKVFLVGAGPGDPELLTLGAVSALRKAEVILCDDLVDERILEYTRPGVRVVRVGKRGGRSSTSQEFIKRLMVLEARSGRIVVRLKGGDPFVFGRGGEEIDALLDAGIDCEVVHGITAGIAAAGAIGVSLTRRGAGHGAIFVSGHDGEGEPVDWASLARTGLPLVIYMGVANCREIQSRLLAGGLAGSTPSAAIANATRPDEISIVTRLDRLAQDVASSGIASPAILLVGKVVSYAACPERLQIRGPTKKRRY
jgi:uroporphyrin-III C-methyltransferase